MNRYPNINLGSCTISCDLKVFSIGLKQLGIAVFISMLGNLLVSRTVPQKYKKYE